MFVKDIKENYASYGLPEEFADCLPDICPTCGAPTEISEVLTGLHCSNPRCPDKIVKRIQAICNSCGILNFGEKTIESFLEYYDVHNPLQIFALRPGMLISDEVSEEVSDKIIAQINEKKSFSLWEYVQIANIPMVQTSAKDIFSGYQSLYDAYKDIEEGGVGFIQKKLGIAADGESQSVRAMQVYVNLMTYKEDLFECEGDVSIIDLSDKMEINIYCSDQAGGGFKRKKDFYNEIERLFGDKVHFNIASVNKKLNYLIWAGADGTPATVTNKVSTVQGYNSKGCSIPIMTADQFISHMKNTL